MPKCYILKRSPPRTHQGSYYCPISPTPCWNLSKGKNDGINSTQSISFAVADFHNIYFSPCVLYISTDQLVYQFSTCMHCKLTFTFTHMTPKLIRKLNSNSFTRTYIHTMFSHIWFRLCGQSWEILWKKKILGYVHHRIHICKVYEMYTQGCAQNGTTECLQSQLDTMSIRVAHTASLLLHSDYHIFYYTAGPHHNNRMMVN